MYRVADSSSESSTPSLHITPLVASSKVSIPADERKTIRPTPSQSHPSIINPLYRIPHTQLAHHASGYAAHRRLRARSIQAQLARPRFPSRYLPHHGRRHLHLRLLACRPGYPRTKVRFSDSNLPSQLSSRVQEQRKRWKNAQEVENTV